MTKTPAEWCKIKGMFLQGGDVGLGEREPNVDWRHAAAAAAHGWIEHEHHAGAPIQLTEADYDAAIAAVQTPTMEPHAPAVSKFSPHAKPASAAKA